MLGEKEVRDEEERGKKRDGWAEWLEAAALWEGADNGAHYRHRYQHQSESESTTKTSDMGIGYDSWLLEKKVKIRSHHHHDASSWAVEEDGLDVGDSCCFGIRTVVS